MFRVVLTYKLPNGEYLSELSDFCQDIGSESLLKHDGKWVMGVVVSQYKFDLDGTIYPL